MASQDQISYDGFAAASRGEPASMNPWLGTPHAVDWLLGWTSYPAREPALAGAALSQPEGPSYHDSHPRHIQRGSAG